MAASELTRLSIAEALDGLGRRAFSARELAEAHLGAMRSAKTLNAFITETPEQALAMAEASDARRARQEALPLDGIPVAVKDRSARAQWRRWPRGRGHRGSSASGSGRRRLGIGPRFWSWPTLYNGRGFAWSSIQPAARASSS